MAHIEEMGKLLPSTAAAKLNEYLGMDDLRDAGRQVDKYARAGLGLDGMPLAPGQSGPRPREGRKDRENFRGG